MLTWDYTVTCILILHLFCQAEGVEYIRHTALVRLVFIGPEANLQRFL